MSARLFLLRLLLLGSLLGALPGCVEPYAPEVISSTESYLVVNGFINSQGPTTISLSRTVALNTATAPPVESKAVVYVEEEGGPRFQLQEATPGTYTSAPLTLNKARKYRLHLTTQGGTEYASDYAPVKTTPAIDEVIWRSAPTGLTVYVNTHDATNTTRYYRWEYEETWEIIPPYSPEVEYVNQRVQPIVTPYPTVCWNTASSSAIRLSKTTALSQDVVFEFPMQSLSATSERLFSKYSILVKQYALTKEEYDYWDLLRKNTENIGTLFDPQPAQLTGNIHCLNNPTEVALGFIGVHSQTEKRLFISRSELPRTWYLSSGYEGCVPPDTVKTFEVSRRFGPNRLYPISGLYTDIGVLYGYTASSLPCIDCRKRGTDARPAFWK